MNPDEQALPLLLRNSKFSAKDRYMETSLKQNEEMLQWRRLLGGRSEARRLSLTLLGKANVQAQSLKG